MNVLITGSDGFIGKNLCAGLSMREDIKIIKFDLPMTLSDLEKIIPEADIVFHLAGVNRPENISEFETGNSGLTGEIVRMLKEDGRNIPLILSSSIQAELSNPYGISKKAAEDAVFGYSGETGAPVYVYRFPNVFGKWCRPNYNSVVATFCHNAANGLPLKIDNPIKELTLLYADDIINEFYRVLDGKTAPQKDGFCTVSPTYNITLGALARAVSDFAESRESLVHGYDRNDPFMRKLYATFLSYLSPDKLKVSADMKRDMRGYFAELIKSPHFGQISVSLTKPGIKRGNHWHNTKVEKFAVLQGDAIIRLKRIGSDEITEYPVSGDKIEIIDIPPDYAHNIENTGTSEVITIFWAGEIFDPENQDTYYLEF